MSKDITPYFEGDLEIFALKDVLFMQKWTGLSYKNYRSRKTGHQVTLNIDAKTETKGILVVFRDSFPCEYPYEDQWDRAVYVPTDNGEAERLLAEWKAYVNAKEGLPTALKASGEFSSGHIQSQQEWLDDQLPCEDYNQYDKSLQAEGDYDILDYESWREESPPELLKETAEKQKGRLKK